MRAIKLLLNYYVMFELGHFQVAGNLDYAVQIILNWKNNIFDLI